MLVKNLCEKQSDECPGDNGYNYECMYCNLTTQDCQCILQEPDHEATLYCYTCNDVREFTIFDTNLDFNTVVGELVDEHDDGFEHYVDISSEEEPIKSAKASAEILYGKCRHRNFPITFPDGTKVFASSQHSRAKNDPEPDLSLYLDWSWNPSGPAYYLDWRDFGLPSSWVPAAKTIIDVFQRARETLWVEIGCIGGHGRTGTVLAAMAVLSGVPAKDAVDWVQKEYCKHAVETDLQAWWVEWFAAWVNATDVPAYPKYDAKTKEVEYIQLESYSDNEQLDLNAENFQALWISAHTTKDVDTSDQVIQREFSQDWDKPDWDSTDFMEEWKKEQFEGRDGTAFPFHYLTHVGYDMVTDYLDGLDDRTIQYIARLYYDVGEEVNSFANIKDFVRSYEEATPEDIDTFLAMDLNEFIEDKERRTEETKADTRTRETSAFSMKLADKVFTFEWTALADVGEAEALFDSLDYESEVWLSGYLGDKFGEVFNLPELIEAVKECDLHAEPF